MRQFTWCRQEVAEFCIYDGLHVHIAITTPGYRAIEPQCGKKKLQFHFYDLDPEAVKRNALNVVDSPEKLQKLAMLLEGCMSEAQGRAMLAFIQAAPENAVVVVNCEGGISRSCGVVLALRRHYGGDTEECFEKGSPNIHIASLLGKILAETAGNKP